MRTVDELAVRTEVHASATEVYELLRDFEGYDQYSKYLRRVRRSRGDGGAGTRYAFEFAWWKLTYTANSEVTAVDPPHRIDWRVTKDIDAHGHWRVEPTEGDPQPDAGDAADVAEESTCEVEFLVRFDPGSASSSAVDLPLLVSFDWVLGKIVPLFRNEAERIVQRAVADLEGTDRPVDLEVTADSDHI